MKNKRLTTIALALAAISGSSSTDVFAKSSKPYITKNRQGIAVCRNIGSAPKVTVCVSGKPGHGRVSDAAIKSAVLSIKKMALVYGSKYSTLSSSQVSKFSTLACGEDPAATDTVSTESSSTEASSEEDSSSDGEALPSIFDAEPGEESAVTEESAATEESAVTEEAAATEESAVTEESSDSSTSESSDSSSSAESSDGSSSSESSDSSSAESSDSSTSDLSDDSSSEAVDLATSSTDSSSSSSSDSPCSSEMIEAALSVGDYDLYLMCSAGLYGGGYGDGDTETVEDGDTETVEDGDTETVEDGETTEPIAGDDGAPEGQV